MAYSKTTWTNGSTALSAEHMNHIENGIADIDSTVSSHTSSLNTLNNTVSGHTTSINSLNGTVSSHTSSIAALQSKFVTGSYVYRDTDNPGVTELSFIDNNVKGKSHIITGTQDAGNPVLRATINSDTGAIKFYLSDPIQITRINYIVW